MTQPNAFSQFPDPAGRFGEFGGRYVAETLMPNILALEEAYARYQTDEDFVAEFDLFSRDFVGRPSPLYFAERLTEEFGGAQIWFKRDELNHTGAHKINNCLGQVLLAKRMGKTRIIAETGAGQHGVATATVAARFGLPCEVFMGATDVERQKPNVFRMKLLGAKVHAVTSGRGTLKDAMNEALRDWVTYPDETFYVIGTVAGPHPYPMMVRDFQSVIGREARAQMLERIGKLPDVAVACIGGGSNAMGLFHPFLEDEDVRLIGVEAAGKGLDTPDHAASLNGGKPGILHGNKTYLLQDEDGQITEGHRRGGVVIAKGVEGIGVTHQHDGSVGVGFTEAADNVEHAFLHDMGRAEYRSATDQEALEMFQLCSKLEGIIPALEPAHALARVRDLATELGKDGTILMNMCGRGDKDVFSVAGALGVEL